MHPQMIALFHENLLYGGVFVGVLPSTRWVQKQASHPMLQVTRQMIAVSHEICLDGGVLQQTLYQDLDTRVFPIDVELGTTCYPELTAVILHESSLNDAVTVRLHHCDVVVVITRTLELVQELVPHTHLAPGSVQPHLFDISLGHLLALLGLLRFIDPATP